MENFNFEKEVKKLVLDRLANTKLEAKEICKEVDEIIATHKLNDEARVKSEKVINLTSTAGTEKEGEKKLSLCPVCESEAEKTCGGCKSVSYCSVEHQRVHWKTHKNLCPSFIIKETETNGKEWIATRDLPADTILLEEAPVLSCPKWDDYNFPCCLSCEIALINTNNKDRKCSNCSWPICSAKCEKSPLHAENECKFFSTHKMKYKFSTSCSPSFWNGTIILLIRASNLKMKNKGLFAKMMKLQDFQVCPKRNYNLKMESVLSCIREQPILRLTNLTEEEYSKLVKIMRVNSFETSQLPLEDKVSIITLLYLQASRMNYSCNPNCLFTTGIPPDFKIRVRTAVPVKKGENLRISYLDDIRLQPTVIRQQYLNHVLGFKCECERCLDPTELGTFMTGIKCQKCRRQKSKNKKIKDDDEENVGYFLAENSLDLPLSSQYGFPKCDPLYKCNGCGAKKLFSVVKSSLPVEIQRALDFSMNPLANLNDLINPVDFLAKFETGGKYLHKNHYLIHTLVEKIIPEPEQVINKQVNKVEMERGIQRLEYLLEIHYLLFPGLSEHKSELVMKLMLFVCRLLQHFSHQLSPADIQKLVLTGQICYKKGMDYFKNDNSSNSQWMPQQLQNGIKFLSLSHGSLMDPSISVPFQV